MKDNAWFKGRKATVLLIVVGVAGVLLVLLSGRSQPKTTSTETPLQYATRIEAQLCDLLAQVKGVGTCSVMVTVHNDIEYLYTAGHDEAITKIQPTVRGVVVVCDGGGDPAVCRRVTEAVTTALGITSGRVCVEQLI